MTLGLIFAGLLIITSILGVWNGSQEHNKIIRKIVEEDNKKNKL